MLDFKKHKTWLLAIAKTKNTTIFTYQQYFIVSLFLYFFHILVKLILECGNISNKRHI